MWVRRRETGQQKREGRASESIRPCHFSWSLHLLLCTEQVKGRFGDVGITNKEITHPSYHSPKNNNNIIATDNG
jgi:hypothetical protein